MSISPKALFSFMIIHFLFFTFFTTRHIFKLSYSKSFKIDSLTVTQSEQGIALMKIREVLVDESSHVIKPTKIVIFPYQWLFLVLYVLFFVLGGVFWIGFYQDQ